MAERIFCMLNRHDKTKRGVLHGRHVREPDRCVELVGDRDIEKFPHRIQWKFFFE